MFVAFFFWIEKQERARISRKKMKEKEKEKQEPPYFDITPFLPSSYSKAHCTSRVIEALAYEHCCGSCGGATRKEHPRVIVYGHEYWRSAPLWDSGNSLE